MESSYSIQVINKLTEKEQGKTGPVGQRLSAVPMESDRTWPTRVLILTLDLRKNMQQQQQKGIISSYHGNPQG